MNYVKCERCEGKGCLNYRSEEEQYCDVCKKELGLSINNPKSCAGIYTGCFLVFQGINYNREMNQKYISAPEKHISGKIIHHWQRMLDVKIGDYILHGLNGYIVALSVAKTTANKGERNVDHNCFNMRIDLETISLNKKILVSNNSKTLLKMQPEVHAPFNKNGDGNQGYLFVVYKEMVKFVIDSALHSSRSEQEMNKIKVIARVFDEKFKIS